MKKLFSILILMMFAGAVSAEELPLQESAQLIEAENAGALLLLQKQPIYEKQAQVIRVRKSGAVTIIQINGKLFKKKVENEVTE